ncbi:MAG: PAS domain-containing protein [Oceanibaculum nanhaiense]|uniref:PAS domain-containing protein n=1 Tax=Oceanibaculum nanhaiense TaxID=1909734 RepID=UPI0032EE03FE
MSDRSSDNPKRHWERPETEDIATAAQFAAFIADDRLLRLFAYWQGKRNGRPMPARSDIDPTEIPWALPQIFLVDYTPESGFRYRLSGTELSSIYGHSNLKGMTLEDILGPEGAAVVTGRWLPLVEQKQVLCMKGVVYLPTDRTAIGERLMLPLADVADGPVTGLLGMTICEWHKGEVAEELKLSRVKTLSVSMIP